MPANVRFFLAFRGLFNARFYYPVLAVMFVDLGLTLDQFALLNVAWAGSIVAFELPLGAWADKIGRRPLIVGAAALMVVEMAVLAFAPTGADLTFAAGTLHSSKTSSTVSEDLIPSFFSIFPTEKPAISFSIIKVDIPFLPFSLSVIANRIIISAFPPLVTKFFTPFST